MSLELFAEFYRRGSAEYKLAMHLHQYAQNDPGCGRHDLRWLADDDDTVNHWFDGDTDTAEQFYTIAATNSSGLFAVWMLDGVARNKAPFVFLGAEGDAHVIAANFAEFVSLLAVPYDDLEFAFSNQVFLPDEPDASFLRFQEWLRETCGIAPAEDSAALVEAAQSQHPSLQTFVEEWADTWFPKQ